MKCKKCKKEIPNESVFCMWCGTAQAKGLKKSMYQRPDGLYERSLTLDGKRVVFRGKTEKEVLQKIAAYNEQKEAGPTFREVAEQWEQEHFPQLSPTTAKGYKPAYERAIKQFGNIPINQIQPKHINAYISQFSRQGWAYKTVKNHLLVISLICKSAVIKGMLEVNPAEFISSPKNLPRNRREAACDEDIQLIKENATFSPMGKLAYFILYTGCRRGEALALTYGDINREQAEIIINKSVYFVNNIPCWKNPKTEAGFRSIPLLQPLVDILDVKPDKELLFPNNKGQLMHESYFFRYWKKYCEETGVSATPHQLRHAFATILFEAGIDDKDAQDIMGHSCIAVTKDIYTHIRKQRKAETLQKLNTYISKEE